MIALKVLLKLILLEVFLVKRGICEKFTCGFNEGFSSCKDFTNELFKGDNMQLGQTKDDGTEAMHLEGYMEITKSIGSGYLIEIDIAKETELGKEPMWSCSLDVCQSLEEEGTPWADAMETMDMKSCPLEAKEYHCSNLTLDLGFLEDKLNHEYVGTYEVCFKVKDEEMNVVACHLLGMKIEKVE